MEGVRRSALVIAKAFDNSLDVMSIMSSATLVEKLQGNCPIETFVDGGEGERLVHIQTFVFK